MGAYAGANSIYDIPATTLKALACFGDQDRLVRVLVEDLLDSTVIAARLAPGSGIIPRDLFVTIGLSSPMGKLTMLLVVAARSWRVGRLEIMVYHDVRVSHALPIHENDISHLVSQATAQEIRV